jgi:hypothetical protein
VAQLASCPADTKISSLHLWPIWSPVLWIPGYLHCTRCSRGFPSSEYENLFSVSLAYLASHFMGIRSS